MIYGSMRPEIDLAAAHSCTRNHSRSRAAFLVAETTRGRNESGQPAICLGKSWRRPHGTNAARFVDSFRSVGR